MTPEQRLREGADILAPLLAPAGFQFHVEEVGQGSGGPFARGAFVRDNRRLELHYRWSLGLVSYTVDATRVIHEDLARAQRAVVGPSQWPGFFDRPLDDFRALLADLRSVAAPFVLGSDDDFRAIAAWVESHPRRDGLARLEEARRPTE